MRVKCNICDSDMEELFRYNREISFLRCNRCDFIKRNPDSLMIDYGSDYVDADFKKKSIRLADDYYKRLSHYFRANCSVLEFGGSLGYFVKKLQDNLHCDVVNYELSDFGRNYSRKIGIKAIANLDELPEDKKFDIIVSMHVIEHVSTDALDDFVESMSEKLTHGGLLIVRTPNSNALKLHLFKKYYAWLAFPEHISFLGEKSANQLFGRHKLKILEIFSEKPHLVHYPSFSLIGSLRKLIFKFTVSEITNASDDTETKEGFKSRIIHYFKDFFRLLVSIESKLYLPFLFIVDYFSNEKDELVIIAKKDA